MLKPTRNRRITSGKILRRLWHLNKEIYQHVKYGKSRSKSLLFIIGCQRSGTAMVTRIFDRDPDSKVYREVSRLSSEDIPSQLRLNPLPKVEGALKRDRAPFIILKPLVESQNIVTLLEFFKGSKAMWLYRHYRDVAASHVKKWGDYNSINDLQAIVDQKPKDWRYEKVAEDVRNVVLEYFSEDMNPYDASALYWFVRNRLFFDLELGKNPDVMLCHYENLVTHPREVVENIYTFVGRNFPGERIINEVNTKAVAKGKDIPLSKEIVWLCETLLKDLNSAQVLNRC